MMRRYGSPRRVARWRLAAVIGCWLVAGVARAGTVSGPTVISTDADTGISAGTTYTHLLDFIADNSAATINGVAFTPAGRTGTGFTSANIPGQILESQFNLGGAGTGAAAGSGLDKLLRDFYYNSTNNGAGQSETITLTNLTPGQPYRLKLFYRQWDMNEANTRFTDVSLDEGSGSPTTVRVNQDESEAARMLVYDYTAGAAGRLVMSFTEGGNTPAASWHQYGLSNQVVPEPAALAAAALGAALLLRRRRG
jgi:MYXO-CTERM domain-containing protein